MVTRTADGWYAVGDKVYVYGTYEGYSNGWRTVTKVTAKSVSVDEWTTFRLTPSSSPFYKAPGRWGGFLDYPPHVEPTHLNQ